MLASFVVLNEQLSKKDEIYICALCRNKRFDTDIPVFCHCCSKRLSDSTGTVAHAMPWQYGTCTLCAQLAARGVGVAARAVEPLWHGAILARYKALTASNRHWGYMSIRTVRQTPYKKYNGTAPTERTDTVIPYRIAHVYVLESGLNFWPCISQRLVPCV